MKTFKVVVEDEIIAYRHSTYVVEAEDVNDAYERCCNGEGACIGQEVTDTCDSNGSSFDLVSIEECE